MDVLNAFKRDLVQYLTKDESASRNLIKFHESGECDFSFPLQLSIWKNYLKELSREAITQYSDSILIYSSRNAATDANQAEHLLQKASQEWQLPISKIAISNNRCFISLNRTGSIKKLLQHLQDNPGYGKTDKEEDETVYLEISDSSQQSITQHRLQVIMDVASNLLRYSKFVHVQDPSLAKHRILLTTKSNPGKDQQVSNFQRLICGVVNDCKTNKLSQQSRDDYIQQRCSDMHLISVHKFGVRAGDAFQQLVEKLGKAAVTLDLLEVRATSAMTLLPDPKQAFILYNSARLQTLMKHFEEKTASGYYPPLPAIADIDASVLKEDEEWLFFKFLLTFPDLMERSIAELEHGKLSLHLIHKYLKAFVQQFSIYYRRVRLLTENRPQLLPALFAKVHLFKAIQRVFNEALAVLSIEPVEFM